MRDLDLSYNRIGDAGAAALAETVAANKHVESLNLRGNDVGPEGCAKIADVLARATRRISATAHGETDDRKENDEPANAVSPSRAGTG